MSDLSDMLNSVIADWEAVTGREIPTDFLLKADRYISICQQVGIQEKWSTERWASHVAEHEGYLREVLQNLIRDRRPS